MTAAHSSRQKSKTPAASEKSDAATEPRTAPQSRLNVNVNQQTSEILKRYSKSNEISVTEAVRRLIAVGDFIAQAQDEGKQVLLRTGDETERVVFTY